jgi:hypothetical protein
MKHGRKRHNGEFAGRDPRKMAPDELRSAGHEPMSPLRALRARCLDCCAGQANEVAACTVVRCPSWPFRMGTDPWRKPASEARRASARRTMEGINARRQTGRAERPASPLGDGIAPSFAEGSGVGPISGTARADRDPKPKLHRVNGTRGTQTDGAVADNDQTAVALDRTQWGGRIDAG